MQLMSEQGGSRVYLAADNATWIEVRAQVRGKLLGASDEEFDAYADGPQAYRDLLEARGKAQVLAWFADEGDDLNLERFGELTSTWERVEEPYIDERTEKPVLDHQGEPIYIYRGWELRVEATYWPPAPFEPEPSA